MAPHPFRVNSEGNACAILAGLNTSATTSASSDVMFHHVWVDYEGDLHQLSTQRRHTSGGGRGIGLTHGPCYTPVAGLWGDNTGPTSRFEISDDGLKVAVVYFRNTTVDPYVSYSETSYRYREDIAAYASTDSSWGSRTVHEVTGDTSTNTGYSTSYVGGKFGYTSSINDHNWRFGALTFTRNGDGLIFWGGYSNYDHDTYLHSSQKYSCAKSFVGSIYSFDFAAGGVRNILAAADGGSNKTVGTAYSMFTYSYSSWQTDGGVIKPVAGFRSADGNFLYIVTRGAVSTATNKKRDGGLIGVNVRSVNAAGSSSVNINNRQDGRGFYVSFPSGMNYNGFLSSHYPYVAMGIGYTYSSTYQNYYTHLGYNSAVVATDNGRVFFTSVTANTFSYTSTSSSYGGSGAGDLLCRVPVLQEADLRLRPQPGGQHQPGLDVWLGGNELPARPRSGRLRRRECVERGRLDLQLVPLHGPGTLCDLQRRRSEREHGRDGGNADHADVRVVDMRQRLRGVQPEARRGLLRGRERQHGHDPQAGRARRRLDRYLSGLRHRPVRGAARRSLACACTYIHTPRHRRGRRRMAPAPSSRPHRRSRTGLAMSQHLRCRRSALCLRTARSSGWRSSPQVPISRPTVPPIPSHAGCAQ